MTQSFNVYQAWSNAKIVLEVGGLGEVFGDSFMTLSPESAPIFPVHPIQDTKPPIIHIQDYFSGPICNIGQYFSPYMQYRAIFQPLYHFYTEIQEIILYRIQEFFLVPVINIGTQKMVYICHRTSAAPRSCDKYRPFFSFLYFSQGLEKTSYIPYIGAPFRPKPPIFCLGKGAGHQCLF